MQHLNVQLIANKNTIQSCRIIFLDKQPPSKQSIKPRVNKLFIEMHKLYSNRRPHGAVFVSIHKTFFPYSRGFLSRHRYRLKNSP